MAATSQFAGESSPLLWLQQGYGVSWTRSRTRWRLSIACFHLFYYYYLFCSRLSGNCRESVTLVGPRGFSWFFFRMRELSELTRDPPFFIASSVEKSRKNFCWPGYKSVRFVWYKYQIQHCLINIGSSTSMGKKIFKTCIFLFHVNQSLIIANFLPVIASQYRVYSVWLEQSINT